MIGTLIDRLRNSNSVLRDGDSMLLSLTDFNRELARERIRATRRSIPFCVLNIELLGRKQLGVRRRTLVRLLHRNVRLTDQKADLGRNRFGILLVDTPEMGGRSVLDRMTGLFEDRSLNARVTLRCHDPDGFDPDQDPHLPTGSGKRRRDDSGENKWFRVDGSAPSSSASAVAVKERSVQHRALQSLKSVVSEDAIVQRPYASRVIKRTVDVVGASVGLVMASPILIGGAIVVKLTSPGPAFFKQTREGMGGRPFTIYKMRTMVVDAESRQSSLRKESHRDGPAFKIKCDPRVTRVGSFMRKTCIDELPQLINVLRGEMSLVGPRPLPWYESRACNHWQRRRLDVPPGMTCHWQVDKAAAETFDDWMRMDLQYVDRHGFWKDLRLIARTALVPITGRGSE